VNGLQDFVLCAALFSQPIDAWAVDVTGQENLVISSAAERRQQIAWGVSPRICVSANVEPRRGDIVYDSLFAFYPGFARVALWKWNRASVGLTNAMRDDDEVNQTIDDVLSDPEFRRLKRKSDQKPDLEDPWWLKDLLDWLSPNVSPGSLGMGVAVMEIVLYSLVFLAVLLVVGLIVRAVMGIANKGRDGLDVPSGHVDEPLLATPPGESPSAEYERRALEFARDGDYKAAIRQLVLGCMSWIERSGFIRYRRGLTNRDYLRAVWRQHERRDSMSVIVQAFELVYFGRRVADAERFELCLENFQGAFRGENGQTVLAK